MNKAEIIQMARKSGMPDIGSTSSAVLERFASLLVSAEREACAQACDKTSGVIQDHIDKSGPAMKGNPILFSQGVVSASRRIAAAIRARGAA